MKLSYLVPNEEKFYAVKLGEELAFQNWGAEGKGLEVRLEALGEDTLWRPFGC